MTIFLIACAVGCQAILGIDSTTFSDGDASSDANASDANGNDGSTSDAGESDAGDVTITFTPARLFVRQGGSADVAVTIARNGFAGSVTVALATIADAGITTTGGPDASPGLAGLGAATITIPAGSNTGTLHVVAEDDAPEGITALGFTIAANDVTSASLPTLVAGDPGSTDVTFGVSGAATGPLSATANSVAIAADDSLYVGGTNGSWILQHYFADGSLDTAFNTTMQNNIKNINGSIARVAVHGTALVFGGVDGNSAFSAQKYTTAGIIDSSFGAAGTFSSTKSSGGYYAGHLTGLAFTSAGAVLMTGVVNDPGTNDGYAYLVDPTGAVHTYGYSTMVTPYGIRPDTNGNIVVGGALNFADGGQQYFVQKLGAPLVDAGAASNGDPNDPLAMLDVVVSPDQQIVIGGLNSNAFGATFASFDENSLAPRLLTYFNHGSGNDNGFDAVAAQADSKLLFTGNNGGQQLNTFVRRYEADGGLDISFGSGGSVDVPQVGMGGDVHAFYDVAVDSWGRIVVVGGDGNVGFYVTRLWP